MGIEEEKEILGRVGEANSQLCLIRQVIPGAAVGLFALFPPFSFSLFLPLSRLSFPFA